MKVLVAAFAYNERPYIPDMVNYYRDQDCDLFILDNFSNDGTYEWLLENNVATARVDTDEAFYLPKLNYELTRHVRSIKPDWVIYCGIDIYYFFDVPIIKEIERAQAKNCNLIEVFHFSAYNTGEEFNLPFLENYFYVKQQRNLQMIGRFGKSSDFRFIADGLKIPNRRVFESDGFLINYGHCKPKEEREETYQRRKKAWNMGESIGHGIHYKPGHERNWIWTKEELTDIRKTEFFKYINDSVNHTNRSTAKAY